MASGAWMTGKCGRTSETLTVGCHEPAHTGSSTPQYTWVPVHIIHVSIYLFISLSFLSLSSHGLSVHTYHPHAWAAGPTAWKVSGSCYGPVPSPLDTPHITPAPPVPCAFPQ